MLQGVRLKIAAFILVTMTGAVLLGGLYWGPPHLSTAPVQQKPLDAGPAHNLTAEGRASHRQHVTNATLSSAERKQEGKASLSDSNSLVQTEGTGLYPPSGDQHEIKTTIISADLNGQKTKGKNTTVVSRGQQTEEDISSAVSLEQKGEEKVSSTISHGQETEGKLINPSSNGQQRAKGKISPTVSSSNGQPRAEVNISPTVSSKQQKGERRVSPSGSHGDPTETEVTSGMSRDQYQTADKWPVFSKDYFPGPIPQSPFHPDFNITWDFNTTAFLQRPDVIGQPPKLMTWMVKTRYTPPLPEPVRLRVCPEMPCRITTNHLHQNDSAALIWAGQLMKEQQPPHRSSPDQVFVFHNHEPQLPWVKTSSFRRPAWKSAFNWTMTYRLDSDIPHVYGKLVKRTKPVTKNYTAIVEAKTKLAAQLVSNCHTGGRREAYVKELQKHMSVHVYGGCGTFRCPRSSDDACIQKFNREYKFFLSFENSFCDDYVSEKFFRYMGGDVVVVARGGADYMKHAAPGTFINTADFQSPQALAEHLLHLDSNPEEYVKVLQAKDQYQSLYEDWPLRDDRGHILYMTYHYGAVAFCQMCQRLWDLPRYQHTVPDIGAWVDKHNCYPPKDLH